MRAQLLLQLRPCRARFLARRLRLPGDERRRQHLAAASAIATGGLLGLARIAQGGHFLSDVVLSGLLVTATSWLLHRTVMVEDWPMAPAKRLALWAI